MSEKIIKYLPRTLEEISMVYQLSRIALSIYVCLETGKELPPREKSFLDWYNELELDDEIIELLSGVKLAFGWFFGDVDTETFRDIIPFV